MKTDFNRSKKLSHYQCYPVKYTKTPQKLFGAEECNSQRVEAM